MRRELHKMTEKTLHFLVAAGIPDQLIEQICNFPDDLRGYPQTLSELE